MATRPCPACGVPSLPGARFCRECGAALGPEPEPPIAQEPFTVGGALQFGWRVTRANLPFLAGVSLLLLVVAVAVRLLTERVPEDDLLASFIANLLWLAVNGVISVGLTVITLKLCDGVRPRFRDLFPSSALVLRYIYVSLVLQLIIIAGLFLLVVPGVILGCIFAFAPYFVVDRGYGVLDALRASARATAGVRWRVFALFLASVGVILAGFAALLVGILVALPVTAVAWTYAYRRLVERAGREFPQPQRT